MKETKICVVGSGRWGLNHINTLLKLNALGGIVDTDVNQREFIKNNFPKISCFDSLENSFKESFDGYVVATPPISHIYLAKQILSKKIPVLVEKPLGLSVKECLEIKPYIENLDSKLLVGHLLLFHPAVKKIKRMINEGLIGEIQYIYSNRLNLGTVRKEENVFWSFAPHDISLFQYFIEALPIEVQSFGGTFLQEDIHDTTITYLKYPKAIQAHIYVSWLHPFKEHRLVVIGSKGSLYFEDSSKNKELFFYEKEILDDSNFLDLKNRPSVLIEYEDELPLDNELKYFIEVIKGKVDRKITFEKGLDVINILELATNSLNNHLK